MLHCFWGVMPRRWGGIGRPPTAGLTVKANVALYRGKWYFEAKLLTGGSLQIGFVDTARTTNRPLGECGHSWAYDGKQQARLHAGQAETYGGRPARAEPGATVRKWKPKDRAEPKRASGWTPNKQKEA